MGFFKQGKDPKGADAVSGLVEQSQQLAAAYQQAALHQQAASGQLQPQPGGLDPIAGVSLQQYAIIVKAIAPLNYDQSALPGIAASHGVDGASWQAAHDGWNARIQGDPAVARAFSDIYRGV